MTADPYDVAVVAAYRKVFLTSDEGLIVLDDLLNSLGHYATAPIFGLTAEVQLAFEHESKILLEKLGVFRYNNLDGYLKALKNTPPRHYEVEEGQEE